MDISIAQTYTLLAYDERTGQPLVTETTLKLAYGAAVILDLVAGGILEIEGSGDQATVHRVGTADDAFFERAAELADGCGIQFAISRQTGEGAKNLCAMRDIDLHSLVQLGALRREEQRVLLLFPRTAWVEADPTMENASRAALRAAVLADPSEDAGLHPHTRAILGLAMQEDLIVRLLDDVDEATVRQRVEQIVDAEPTGGALAEAIATAVRSVTAAMLVTAVIAPPLM